jgi:hypothetical protein
MVTMMSCTLILGLINCLPFSSNSIGVKYSQVLMYAIATCISIQSFASISSSSFSLLFEELNLQFKKIYIHKLFL